MNLLQKAVYPIGKPIADWYFRNGYCGIGNQLAVGGPTHSGEKVDEHTALNSSVVFACNRILAETVGSLPLMLYRRTRDGKEREWDHPLAELLHDAPNPEMSAMAFREALSGHVALWGNAYARKVTRASDGRVIALWPLMPCDVTVERNDRGALVYTHKPPGTNYEKKYSADDIFHLPGLSFDGLIGYSIIHYARQSIGSALAAEKYGAKYFSGGGRPPGVLKYKSWFQDREKFQQTRDSWNQTYGPGSDPNKTIILEDGMEYQQLGLSPQDSQFLETRQFSVPEICRWFRIAPHMVGDLTRSTNNNIEHQSLEFVTYTLRPWLVRWEQAIQRQLMDSSERKKFFPQFIVEGLLRGAFEAQAKGFSTYLQNGVYSINEVRALLNFNDIGEEGDRHVIQLNMQPVDMLGQEPEALPATGTDGTPAPKKPRNPGLVRVKGMEL